MKVLFAVNDENISTSIVKKYQKQFKEIISYKNVYYFNAILKELQKNKNYDRIVISEDLEEFTSTSIEQKDKFIFDRLDSISDEATSVDGKDIPIILICSERRTKSEDILVKLFGISIYNAIIGDDRTQEEVCNLINKPRTKKEAKIYYRIESDNVSYEKEDEGDVSEMEIQNILTHFKRIGKNEEKYVESFADIVTQYTDDQMKVVVAILPEDVKSVLEQKSPEYKQLIKKGIIEPKEEKYTPLGNTRKPIRKGTSEKLLNTEGKVAMSKPVVVPSSIDKSMYQKTTPKKQVETYEEDEEIEEDDVELDDVDLIEEEVINNEEEAINNEPEIIEEKPKRRGRPKKNTTVEKEEKEEKPKKRGRPKKNTVQEEIIPEDEEEIEEVQATLPGFGDDEEYEEEYEEEDTSTLPGFDDEEDEEEYEEEDTNTLPGFDVDDEEEIDNDEQEYEDEQEETEEEYEQEQEQEDEYVEEQEEYVQEEYVQEEYEQEDEYQDEEQQEYEEPVSSEPVRQNNIYNNYASQSNEIIEDNGDYDNTFNDIEYENLLTGDKKVVTVVGTHKNGTSFIVNNIAQVLSSMGVNVAILDATEEKNSYYIYTKNEENLRKIAVNSFENLINGTPEGIRVNNNLTVYTTTPNNKNEIKNSRPILETLIREHSLVLIDCDFKTPAEYFERSQEIYLVQTMDVLTIQPLTEFLRDLKSKNALKESKIRIIINKALHVRGANSKNIVGGMSNYNDPEMSYMTELFDRNSVKVSGVIPFDEDVYIRYLEALIECEIKINSYPKEFRTNLNSLAEEIYPMLPESDNKNKKKKNKKGKDDGYVPNSAFSSGMNNTLDNMRKKY